MAAVEVQVPPGLYEGDTFVVSTADGQEFNVIVPPNIDDHPDRVFQIADVPAPTEAEGATEGAALAGAASAGGAEAAQGARAADARRLNKAPSGCHG